MTDRVTALRSELEPIVASLGLSIYDLTLGGGDRPTLAVLVDRPDGVDLDAIETATRTISAMLDTLDPMHGQYLLEVSSPGLERPLRTAEHFAGAIDEVITLKTRDESGHVQRVRGSLVSVDGAAITVRSDSGDLTVALDVVEQARTVFVWGPAPKPGKGSRPGRKKEVAQQ